MGIMEMVRQKGMAILLNNIEKQLRIQKNLERMLRTKQFIQKYTKNRTFIVEGKNIKLQIIPNIKEKYILITVESRSEDYYEVIIGGLFGPPLKELLEIVLDMDLRKIDIYELITKKVKL